ncbi:dihydrolipoamide acetyltransferase family protein [Endozoicomonas elysicola]|uniref:Dihydrolipoamide acetyltransferase component of pyruvate dehydrogenase complex n=1 Tax=Endozoicomonas elysicola TaxID=305900 RepID=A0A081K5C9_9GAMM|nr:dihydrolipoamide acetyltransferase family protein [Endozoicomonas elysicola]KEI69355.1 branched-chain alpha-keto acid dehydrogenase subunit E2 [Endozoicomonas elysicola]
MRFFNLPDLGEGIPEADIVEWHVYEGDSVKEDQPMVSVETAKAIVEVPAPCTGVIARLYGQPGDTILTGAPLVEFVSDQEDSGTVVGKLASDDSRANSDESFIIGSPSEGQEQQASSPSKAQQNLQALAEQFSVDLGSAASRRNAVSIESPVSYSLENPEPLKGVRKHMARTMAESHAAVVPVTLFDDVDIDHWQDKEDITVRLIQAIAAACEVEPALNAWFDGSTLSRQLHGMVNLGLAVDSEEGLFVPVIRDAARMEKEEVRTRINELREGVKDRSLPNSELQGATITLSNFGVFAGKYATPVVVPPMVCIIGVGRLRNEIVSISGKPESHRMLPLSLSFDHRAATGGEATRFLHAMIQQLQK